MDGIVFMLRPNLERSVLFCICKDYCCAANSQYETECNSVASDCVTMHKCKQCIHLPIPSLR